MRCGCSSWLGCIPYRIFLIAFLYHSLKSIPRRDALFFCPFTPRRRRRRKFGTLVRLLGVVWFPGVPGVRLPNLVSPPRSCRKRGYPQEFSTVWRTYMRVILAPCAGGPMCLKNSGRLENSCNYRLLRSLKPRGNS